MSRRDTDRNRASEVPPQLKRGSRKLCFFNDESVEKLVYYLASYRS